MGGISLTASMRSNLLSLQNISGQVSSTQNKLATGNKVNSAIDNPSSYYTALSLNNRADDLNALLDSMGQAVSTIKAATTALESATEFLEQASAVATQALETAKIPSKSFFEEKVGENGAVVTTAQELRDAINFGKETICVYGAIDLDDISQTGGLTLQENQKLVGIGYFGNYDTDTNKFSSISATANAVKNMIDVTKNGCVVSDLSLNYTNMVENGETKAIYINGNSNKIFTELQDLDIKTIFSESNANDKAAIQSYSEANTSIKGNINLQISGKASYGIFILRNGTCNVNSGSKIYIKTTEGSGINVSGNSICNVDKAYINIDSLNNGGIRLTGGGILNVNEGQVNIQTSGKGFAGIHIGNSSICNINSNSLVNILTQGQEANGIHVVGSGSTAFLNIATKANISINTMGINAHAINVQENGEVISGGNLLLSSKQGNGVHIFVGTNQFNILSSGNIYFKTENAIKLQATSTSSLDIATGAKLAFEKDSKTEWYEIKADYHDENTSYNNITVDNVKDKLNVETTTAWELPEKVEIDFEDGNPNGETAEQDLTDASKNYQEIINQYDALIKDAGYKGINLLQTEKLTVKFNETNTADLSVQGKDMSSQALGFKTFDWQTQGDIADSLAEIASALKSIRNYSAELGNNYSIITTRQDFTESLVNVLTEGADKLTLADMNEESANMLALQTRQQLAINSLSLASQASQSILKLF